MVFKVNEKQLTPTPSDSNDQNSSYAYIRSIEATANFNNAPAFPEIQIKSEGLSKGSRCIFLFLDFSKKKIYYKTEKKQANEDVVFAIFKIYQAEEALSELGVNFKVEIAEINCRNTNVSMRLFRDVRISERVVREVKKVDLSFTQFSLKGLLVIQRMKRLTTLVLDGCNPAKNVGFWEFRSPLSTTVYKVSMVQTSLSFGKDFLKTIETLFPNIHVLDFTQDWEHSCFFGTIEPVQLCPLVKPVLAGSCGHVISLATYYDLQRTISQCWCHGPLDVSSDLIPTPFLITRFSKKPDGKWLPTLLDNTRVPIMDQARYHIPCGSLYNEDSLELLNQVSTDESTCATCLKPFTKENFRAVFINSIHGDDDELDFP